MSEVVPLPSFGEVFFDARGQERCLRVTWHEGTLVLSLWRGEMCTASFRMPMEDVGRLLDTLDEGFAEATGEQPAVPAHDPGTEVIPGTGQYQRPQTLPPAPVQQQPEERPTATLSPSDVLVARGTPPRQDKLVASYSDPPAQRDPYGDSSPYADTAAGQYGDPSSGQYGDTSPGQYGERAPFTGPQYSDPQYSDPGTGRSYAAPQQYAEPQRSEPFTGPQYVDDTPSGPQYSLDPDPFSGPHPVAGERGYQLPRERQAPPHSTDPLGFPSQASDPYAARTHDRAAQDRYVQDDRGYQGRSAGQAADTAADLGAAGLGTPMHGIPGAGRPRSMPQRAAARHTDRPAQDPYTSGDSYRVGDGYASLDRPSQDYQAQDYQAQDYPSQDSRRQDHRAQDYRQQDPQAQDYRAQEYRQQDYPAQHNGARDYAGQDYPVYPPPTANPVDPLLALGTPEPGHQYQQQPDGQPLSRPYVGDPMFSTGERLRPDQQYDDRDDRRDW